MFGVPADPGTIALEDGVAKCNLGRPAVPAAAPVGGRVQDDRRHDAPAAARAVPATQHAPSLYVLAAVLVLLKAVFLTCTQIFDCVAAYMPVAPDAEAVGAAMLPSQFP